MLFMYTHILDILFYKLNLFWRLMHLYSGYNRNERNKTTDAGKRMAYSDKSQNIIRQFDN